jgi:hypothetical protein
MFSFVNKIRTYAPAVTVALFAVSGFMGSHWNVVSSVMGSHWN